MIIYASGITEVEAYLTAFYQPYYNEFTISGIKEKKLHGILNYCEETFKQTTK